MLTWQVAKVAHAMSASHERGWLTWLTMSTKDDIDKWTVMWRSTSATC